MAVKPTIRVSLVAIGLLLAAALLAGCGSSGPNLPKNIVVEVGNLKITKAEDEQALSVAAIYDARSRLDEPSIAAFELADLAKELKEPRLIVPIPPKYTACIARVREHGAKPPHGTPRPSTAEVRRFCEKIYLELQEEALGPLIIADWDLAEASQDGITVSEAQVHEQLEKELHSQSHPVALQTVLSESGKTISEVLQATKVTLLREMLNQRAIPNHSKLSQETVALDLRALTEESEHKWSARTICREGYVIKYCKGYKAPPQPKVKPAKASPPAQPIAITPPAAPSSTPPLLKSKG
jgi:hypothetical protein